MPTPPPQPPPAVMAAGDSEGPGQDVGAPLGNAQSRRRRWPRKRRASARGQQEQLPAPAPGGASVKEQGIPPLPNLPASRPRRIINRSAKIMRAEHDLYKALSVSVVGDTAALLIDVLAVELAHRYELPAELPEFHRLSPDDFLLNLPDEPGQCTFTTAGGQFSFRHSLFHASGGRASRGRLGRASCSAQHLSHWRPCAHLGIGDDRASAR
jgi:hypothetical protein